MVLKQSTRHILNAGLLLALTACSNLPRPGSELPALPTSYYQPTTTQGKSLSQAELALWWQQFDAPVLSQLVEQALAHNLDLQQALSRVEQARALEQSAGALLLPNIGLGAQAKRFYGSDTDSLLLNQAGITDTSATYWQASLRASWELDLFGAGRARLAASREQTKAMAADVQAVRLSLSAAVASLYVNYRGLQQQEQLLQEGLREAREIQDIAEHSFTAGLVQSTDIDLARAGVAQIQARLEQVNGGIALLRLNLESICGVTPGELQAMLTTQSGLPALPAEIKPGQPLDLLARRPDVMATQARLLAALKQSDAARLDYWPKFGLAGAAGRSSLDLGSGIPGASGLRLLSLVMMLPLIDFGAREAQVKLMDARSKEALLAYENSARQAMFDVERALAQLERDKQQQLATRAELAQRSSVFDKVRFKIKVGEAGRLDIAQARVALLDTRSALLTQQVQQLQSQIALFRAMGGGWEPEPH
ncbi:efflux transporter outer membrane subunit [Neisseriaceae bacterium TC5R-5]|nr:efflux transporter outer membrane subunit [Neisseriaceae bacterium TC5R-5]